VPGSRQHVNCCCTKTTCSMFFKFVHMCVPRRNCRFFEQLHLHDHQLGTIEDVTSGFFPPCSKLVSSGVVDLMSIGQIRRSFCSCTAGSTQTPQRGSWQQVKAASSTLENDGIGVETGRPNEGSVRRPGVCKGQDISFGEWGLSFGSLPDQGNEMQVAH